MKTRLPLILLVVTLAGAFGIGASAQTQGDASAKPSAVPAVDPDAVAALKRMGAYLQNLKTFQVAVATTSEDVLDDGQKLQFAQATDMLVQRPNGVRIKVVGDRRERRLFFDGTSFTLWAPRVNFYASVPAPPTIHELIGQLDEKFGIELPLLDLFRWGTSESSEASITGAMNAGLSAVEGASCTQYAFRQPGLDWQIWIQNGENPLPRKLVVTTMTDEARPQFTAVYAWNLAPAFNAAAFTFVPPPGASKITLAEIKSGTVAKQEKSP